MKIIPNQKHLFNIPEEITYLNCCYMSPQLLSVTRAGEKALLRKQEPWKINIDDFFVETEITRNLFAQLIDSNIDDIAIIPSASYGLAIAAKNLHVKANSKIIMLNEQFPSNVLVWKELAKKKGANTVFLKDTENIGWTNILLQSIDENTSIVAIPNVHWSDGRIINLEKISQRCKQFNAALVLDLTQSVGAIPFSAQKVQPDFMVTATYKWLLGPYSMGFLYVNPKQQLGEPIEHNWINRKRSENFPKLASYENEFKIGSRRFDVGERSNFVLMPMVRAALEQIHLWKVLNIRNTLLSLTIEISKKASDIGLSIPKINQSSPNFIGIKFNKKIPDGLEYFLTKKNVFVSIRGNSMRVSPHVYNSIDDINELFRLLELSLINQK